MLREVIDVSEFWKLVRESVIVQGLVTLALVGSCIYLSVVGQPIPETIQTATMLSLGFYFGSKVTNAAMTAYRKG
jgi:biotin transporter BioY